MHARQLSSVFILLSYKSYRFEMSAGGATVSQVRQEYILQGGAWGGGGGASQNWGSVQTQRQPTLSLAPPPLAWNQTVLKIDSHTCPRDRQLVAKPVGSSVQMPEGSGTGGRASSELRGGGAPTPPAHGREQATNTHLPVSGWVLWRETWGSLRHAGTAGPRTQARLGNAARRTAESRHGPNPPRTCTWHCRPQ